MHAVIYHRNLTNFERVEIVAVELHNVFLFSPSKVRLKCFSADPSISLAPCRYATEVM